MISANTSEREEKMQPQPIDTTHAQIGDMVRYVHLADNPMEPSPNISCALVTKVRPSGRVDLRIFFSTGDFISTDVEYGANQERGTWHWG